MPPILPRRSRRLFVAAAVLGLGFALGWIVRGGGGAAEAQEDPTVLAETELTRLYEALAGRGDLADILGDAFQVMRTDGTRYDKTTYLTRPPSVAAYKLGDVRAFQAGDVLTATYFDGVTGTVEGTGIASEDQPRLAVFVKDGEEWKLQAIANLGMGLQSDPAEAGKKAVDAWVGAVASGDTAVVKKVLAPEFQIIRSDGTAYNAQEYLQSELPRFPEPPKIGTLVVTGYGDYLVARYEIESKITLGDEIEMRYGPRLTVFRKGHDGAWLVVAHANLAALER